MFTNQKYSEIFYDFLYNIVNDSYNAIVEISNTC